jgi:hypothetical protein
MNISILIATIVFLLLFVWAIYDYKNKKSGNNLFWVIKLLIIVFMVLYYIFISL